MLKLFTADFGYHEHKPVMILVPNGRDNRKRFVIKLADTWKYSEDHNDKFEEFMLLKTMQILDLYQYDRPSSKREFVQVMSSVANTIMSGIDQLVKMPPYEPGFVDPELVIDEFPALPEGSQLIVKQH
jgi:hypothetical protein